MELESSDTAPEMYQLLPVSSDTAVASSDTLMSSDMGLATSDTASEMHQLLPVSFDTAMTSSDTLMSSDMGLATSDTALLSSNRPTPNGSLYEPPFTGGVKIENNKENCSLTSDSVSLKDVQIKVEALCTAFRTRDLASVKRLLAEGACFTDRMYGCRPLQMCIHCFYPGALQLLCTLDQVDYEGTLSEKERRATEIEIIKELLTAASQADNKDDILNGKDIRGRSPLDWAILCSDLEIVKALVDAGASLVNNNNAECTALHAAVGHHRILKYFLDNHNIPNSQDKNGYTPLHWAAFHGEVESFKLLLEKFGAYQVTFRNNTSSTVWHHIALFGRLDLANFLLQPEFFKHRFVLNLVDNQGRTPVFLSVYFGHAEITALLLRNGAALSVKEEKATTVELIAARFSKPLAFFEDVLDGRIYDQEDSIIVNYEILTDDKEKTQIKIMEEFMRCGQSKILRHPLMESLIYLKWKCFLPVFYVLIATYAMFLGALNIFVITMFHKIDTSNGTLCTNVTSTDMPCERCGWQLWMFVPLIYISIGVLITQECVWIYLQRLRYFKLPESMLKLSVLTLGAAVPMLVGCEATVAPAPWQRHVACLAVLLAWLQAMLLLSRFPGWGYYVLMFERVAINIMKVFVTSICLVVGFSTCFMIQYQSKAPFDGPAAAFTKTLVMMSSEFDYEGLFTDHDKMDSVVVRLLFVAFVIFIAIVLMNVIIAVAVSDINELNAIGNVRRLEKQVELLSTLEALVDTLLVKWWKRLSCIRYHRVMYRPKKKPGRKWYLRVVTEHDLSYLAEFLVNPSDDIQNIPSELHNAIIDIAKRKKQANKEAQTLQDSEFNNKDDSNLSVLKLDRIKSIEDASKELKQSVNDLKNIIDRKSEEELNRVTKFIDNLKNIDCRVESIADTNSEMKQSIDSLREDVNKILAFVALGAAQTNKRRALSSSVSPETKGT